MTTTDAGVPVTNAATDFESVRTLAARPVPIFEALTSADAITSWWGPTVGSAAAGGSFVVRFGGERLIDLRVVTARSDRVEWRVLAAPHTPEWDGTTIVFELESVGESTELRFRHCGLTPELECFDMCHSGWTHYLGSLASYVVRGDGDPYQEG